MELDRVVAVVGDTAAAADMADDEGGFGTL